MANLTTTDEILDYALYHAGEPTNGTSDYEAQVLIEANRAYRAIWMGGSEFAEDVNEKWWWLRKTDNNGYSLPGTLTLDPVIDTLTATVTNNNQSVTMSAAPSPTVSANVESWFFKVDDHADVFRVTEQSGATLTLDSVYTGPSGAGKACKLFKLDYDLASDVLRVIAPMRVYREREVAVQGMDLEALERRWPLNDLYLGTPTAFAVLTSQRVRFNKFTGTSSTDLTRVDYDYHELPADLTDSSESTPVIPKEYRYILADAALYFLLLNKDDDRDTKVLARVQAGLRAMMKENRASVHRTGDLYGKIQPRQDKLDRFRGPRRTESGLII